jgi:hypothetical protein
MAKIVNQTKVNLTGISVKQLAHLSATQIKGYDRQNLARIVTKLDSAANKRLVRLEKAGYNTPAMRAAKVDKGERFSVAGKNLKELRASYIRVSNFLKSDTSTKKGYKSFLKKMQKAFADKGVKIGGGGDKYTQDFIQKETKIFDWLKEKNPIIEESGYKYEALEKISEYVNQDNLSESAIKKRMAKWVKETYEEEQRRKYIDTSNFFDITEDEE